MNKKFFKYVTSISVAAVIVLATAVWVCIGNAEKKMTQYSFDELTSSTRHLAGECADTINTDKTILSAMASLISMQDPSDTARIVEIMNSVDFSNTFITRVELITSDNKLLSQNGELSDMSGIVNFSEEAAKGSYVSGKRADALNPDAPVLYNSVPVIRNGHPTAVLRGVLLLEEISKTYSVKLYGGEAFVLIVDGDTGEILLDTWHNSLSSISALGRRKMLMGYSYEESVENMRSGKSGDLAFISKTTNTPVYLHYEPIAVNNWSITLGVGEKKALEGTRASVRSLYIMAVIIGSVLLLHMGLIAWNLFSAYKMVYKMSITDQGTNLNNRSAYEQHLTSSKDLIIPYAVCIYIDANGLHELNNRLGHDAGDKMLKSVADSLQQNLPDAKLYRIGGDEFVAFPAGEDEEECRNIMSRIEEELNRCGYSISYGISARRNEKGLNRIVREADCQMLLNKKEYYSDNKNRNQR